MNKKGRSFIYLFILGYLNVGVCQLIGNRGVFTLAEGQQWRDTSTLTASEQAGRFARSYQRQAEQTAEANRRFGANTIQESPRFYTSQSGEHAGRKMSDLEIFDFTDSRYVNPLPETRENKPNPELEAERAETAASQASAAAGFVAAGFGSGLQGFNTASSQLTAAPYQPAVAYQPVAVAAAASSTPAYPPPPANFPTGAVVSYPPAPAAAAYHPDVSAVHAAVTPTVSLGSAGNFISLPSGPSHSFSTNYAVGNGAKGNAYVDPSYPAEGSVNYYSLNSQQIY